MSIAAVPALIAVPVVSKPAARPHPVAPSLHSVALGSFDRPAAGARLERAVDRGRSTRSLSLTRSSTPRFSAVGVTWRDEPTRGAVTVRVRHRLGHGPWSAWQVVGADDVGDDQVATANGALQRGGTDMAWTGPSDAVDVRASAVSGKPPRDLSVSLVDPGSSSADASTGSVPSGRAEASAGRPTIRSRAAWGADESIRRCCVSYSSTLKAAVVHHTAQSSNYGMADVPALIRADYAFHVRSRGWSDLGYNFVVDKWGRIWEGRYGGVDKPVIGAHAGGFNVNTVGVAMLGDFTSVTPPAAMQRAVARVIAWRLGSYRRNPYGFTQLTSAGGGTSRYASGTVVTKPVVMAHRDVGYTSCPGNAGYARMSAIRSYVRYYMQVGEMVDGSVSPTTVAAGSATGVVAGGRTLSTRAPWRLTVTALCPQRVVRTVEGTATGRFSVRWNLRDDRGAPVRPGAYLVRIAGVMGGAFERVVTVTTPPVKPPLATGALPAATAMGFVPVTPTRVLDTGSGLGSPRALPVAAGGRLDLRVTGVAGVPASGVGAVALQLHGVCATAPSRLTAWPAGTTASDTAAVTTAAGGATSGLTVVRVGRGGSISLAPGAGQLDIAADVVGYFSAAASTQLSPVAPRRVWSTGASPLAAGETRTVAVSGPAGLSTDVHAVALTVVARAPRASGTVTVYPEGSTRPSAGGVDIRSGSSSAGRVVTALSATGTVAVHNGTAGPLDLALDLDAQVVPPSQTGTTARFTALPPTRALSTYSGLGTASGPIPAAGSRVWAVAGHDGVPSDATAVALVLHGTASAQTVLTVAPTGTPRPSAPDVVTGPTDRWASSIVLVPLGVDGAVRLDNTTGDAQVIADIAGYWR